MPGHFCFATIHHRQLAHHRKDLVHCYHQLPGPPAPEGRGGPCNWTRCRGHRRAEGTWGPCFQSPLGLRASPEVVSRAQQVADVAVLLKTRDAVATLAHPTGLVLSLLLLTLSPPLLPTSLLGGLQPPRKPLLHRVEPPRQGRVVPFAARTLLLSCSALDPTSLSVPRRGGTPPHCNPPWCKSRPTEWGGRKGEGGVGGAEPD